MRLNNKGQLTTGEWCNDKDNSGQALTVQWCQMGTVNGPWHYDAQQKMMLHTGINKCLGLEPESGRPILRACDNHRTGMRIFKRPRAFRLWPLLSLTNLIFFFHFQPFFEFIVHKGPNGS